MSKKSAESKEDGVAAAQLTCSLAVSFHCFFSRTKYVYNIFLISGQGNAGMRQRLRMRLEVFISLQFFGVVRERYLTLFKGLVEKIK